MRSPKPIGVDTHSAQWYTYRHPCRCLPYGQQECQKNKCVSTFGNLRSIAFCYSRKNEQSPYNVPTTVQFEKKNSPWVIFGIFPWGFPNKLHQTTSRLPVSGKTRGRRTSEPRHVAFSSGYSIAIFIRHAFGKFVSWSLVSVLVGRGGFLLPTLWKSLAAGQIFESFLQREKTLFKTTT